MLEIHLEPELAQRLLAVAAQTGRSSDEIAQKAICELVEDLEDMAIAEAALKNPGRRWTMEEIRSGADLSVDDLES